MSETPTQQHSAAPAAGEALVDAAALGDLIHALRTPLTVIAGYAHMASRADATDIPLADLMDPILRSVQEIEGRLALLSDQLEAAEPPHSVAS